MMNTVLPGDRLVIQKSFGQIKRGAIVVFQFPGDPAHYLSRVIGLPGETIQVRGRTVYINDHPLQEQKVIAQEESPYSPLKEISTEGNGPYRVFYTRPVEDWSSDDSEFGTSTPFQIPNDNFFLMSDHRDNSQDSRFRGPVSRRLIWGEASIIYYSDATTSDGKVRWERMLSKVR
jgi:signal peptidase I